jgi:type II secretory pathway pseudopilin PulG
MKRVESIKYKACPRPRSGVESKDKRNLSIFNFQFSIFSGFTLVEMMVSIAIFMVVAVVAVAALLKIVDANRKSQTLQDAVNNINFAMDSITREIRVGSAYDCYQSGSGLFTGSSATANYCPNTSNDSTNGSSIAFLSSNTGIDSNNKPCNLTYSYYFEPITPATNPPTWTIEKAQQSPGGHCTDSLGGTYAPIIDPSIVITNYTIKVVEGDTSTNQPSVFLYIRGYTGKQASTQTFFDIQTTISKRNRGN